MATAVGYGPTWWLCLSAGLGLGHKDGYRGRLRSTTVLWWLQGLAEDDEYGFCGLKGPECQ